METKDIEKNQTSETSSITLENALKEIDRLKKERDNYGESLQRSACQYVELNEKYSRLIERVKMLELMIHATVEDIKKI